MLERLKRAASNPRDEYAPSPLNGAAFHLLMRDLGPRYAPERVKTGTYVTYDAKQSRAIELLKAFRNELPVRLECGAGLIVYGSVGTGKDHLMAALLYRAAELGERCRWVNGQDLYGSVRDRMDSGAKEEDWMRLWAEPRVLGLSDPIPPAGDLSAWRTELLYRLVDRRYRAMKSTWVTLNANTPEEAERQLSHQVFDRLAEGAVMVPCFWPSWRDQGGR